MRTSSGRGPDPATTTSDGPRRAPWGVRTWALVIVGVATILGFVATLQSYYAYRVRGREADFWEMAAYTLPDWFLWAALTPFVVWLARRVPVTRGRWVRAILFHLCAGTLLAFAELLASCVLISAVAGLPAGTTSLWDYYIQVISFFSLPSLLIYGMILGAGHTYDFYRKYRSAEVRASELQARLAEARLRTLRWHLRPHFLFNTLHTIGVLTRKRETERALAMVTGLGDLLRHSLEHGDQEVSLEEELAFVRRYVEVEQVRFGDRLEPRFDVPDDLLGAQVPNLVLQPLVEGAIEDGVAPYRAPCRIHVSARRDGEWLELRVRDETGCPDAARAGRAGRSDRLEDLGGRLRSFYGDRFRLGAAGGDGTSYTATVRIPWRRVPGASGAVPPARATPAPPARALGGR